MTLTAISAFWISVAVALYVYAGYPLLIAMLSRFYQRPGTPDGYQPRVTLIIPARNEEQWIRHKIENTLTLDYPRSLLRIVIASDGSTDRTVAIAREFENEGVEVSAFLDRQGASHDVGLGKRAR